jgi:hypothetical protein
LGTLDKVPKKHAELVPLQKFGVFLGNLVEGFFDVFLAFSAFC